METKLYVGNLAFGATEDDLKATLSQAGNVTEVTIVRDRATGRSKGFAFVTFETAEGVQKAIDTLQGATIKERAVHLNVARPREERPAGGPRNFGGGDRGGYGGGRGGDRGGYGGGGRGGDRGGRGGDRGGYGGGYGE